MNQFLGQIGCLLPVANFAARMGLSLFLVAGAARGTDLPALTLDLPVAKNLATPLWLGHPTTPHTTFATLKVPILSHKSNAALLVTVYFEEKVGGLLRVTWTGSDGPVVLSDNFYEDIGMANQRSLLVSPTTLTGDGFLTFQTGDTELNISRIKLEWLDSTEELVSPQVKQALVTSTTGTTQAAAADNGQKLAATKPVWSNEVVTVPISDDAMRIEQGVEFSVDLDSVPTAARLSLKETGLPLGQHLAVWINEKRAGSITPSVPELTDSGFFTTTKSQNYVGWRDASFYVPVKVLKSGVNSLQFSAEDDADASSATVAAAGVAAPLALKAIAIQLNYHVPTPEPVETPVFHLSVSASLNPTP